MHIHCIILRWNIVWQKKFKNTTHNYEYLLKLVIVYMLGLLPFLLKILMDVKVTMRKTVNATDRPTKREKSVAIISSCWAAKKAKSRISSN